MPQFGDGLFDASSLYRDDMAPAISIVFSTILVLGDHDEISFSTRTLLIEDRLPAIPSGPSLGQSGCHHSGNPVPIAISNLDVGEGVLSS